MLFKLAVFLFPRKKHQKKKTRGSSICIFFVFIFYLSSQILFLSLWRTFLPVTPSSIATDWCYQVMVYGCDRNYSLLAILKSHKPFHKSHQNFLLQKETHQHRQCQATLWGFRCHLFQYFII